jgi:hypothetical protein
MVPNTRSSLFLLMQALQCYNNMSMIGTLSGSETDIDCGGNCTTCTLGSGCVADNDCTSGNCDTNICVVASGTIPNGQACTNNNECLSGICSSNKCLGAIGDLCTLSSECNSTYCDASGYHSNGVVCTSPSPIGGPCDVHFGCTTLVCTSNVCAAKIAIGNLYCEFNGQCATGWCGMNDHKCVPISCMTTEKDGLETDIDCGGGFCSSCTIGRNCTLASDCSSGLCTSGICVSTFASVGSACTLATQCSR